MFVPPPIPTLEDVARVAGVSTATVSRCLNGKGMVSAKSRDKVMQAVEALGYTPNFGARAMAAKRTHTIGAVIPTMENAIFARGLQAFQETLHGHGYNLLLSSSAYRPELEAEQIRALIARGADGLLLIGYARDAAVYDMLSRRGIPTMLAWASLPDSPHPSVGFDNRGSMRHLADAVLGLGHRRMAVISGIVAGNDRAACRLAGIRDSWTAHGFDLADLAVIETPYGVENGAAALAQHMQAATPPSVVMCGNDVLAAGAIARARDMGLDLPGDLSITGFDDIELARLVTPALTTVHVPHREMGRTAARELVNLIEGRSGQTRTELAATVVMRSSLGPPAS
ncbi:LacI family DNA-binding transcriptional regulator [Jannaschia sp. M317]|uniref:LacI family DNA-binding transcriptional regulator n=1 Tax=Jannaschia sp. M317 TaxID=2867011 RepID=UPI0021A66390|nr:LacI family DNA-binding transcriptional regulator [Jannaschia sp. M317]UWQ16476.1 LacI family DNA-binding transcriptional regulator [Jannaschia sp. M317]